MMICNPFKATEWKFITLFRIILAVQISLCGLICLDHMNMGIPLIRQFIGFIYITFVPGILIIRILRLNKIDNIDASIYSLGFSIIFLMFIGFAINFCCPLIGVDEPISETVLIITINSAVLLLCFINYMQKEYIVENPYIYLSKIFTPPTLLLLLIPFFSILGTYYVNFHENNFLLMVLFVLISVLFMLAINDKFISKDLYGLMIYLTSISLLFHISLISMYIIGADIHVEYYFSNLVYSQQHWNSTSYGNINSMLSVVILAPLYSIICKLDLTWVFKIIFPSIFSFLPLGIYSIYKKQLGDKKAFISVFYFISIITFYTEMLSLARQQIAEILLIIIILTMISERSEQDISKKRFVLIIFSFGLAVSHYGLSYLILIFGIISYIFLKYGLKYPSETFRLPFLTVFSVFALSWYIYNSGGSSFEIIVNIFNHIYSSIGEEVLSTSSTTLATKFSSYYTGIFLKTLYLVSQFFILIGFSVVLYEELAERKKSNFNYEYLSLSFMFLLILISSVLTSATGMNIHRLFHLASITLSPFVFIGYTTIVDFLKKKLEKISINSRFLNPSFSLNIFGLILVLFFLLNVGFIQELIKEEPKSISLSQSRIEGNNDKIINLYATCTNELDVRSIVWIANHRNSMFNIYSDLSTKILSFESYGGIWRDEYLLKPKNNDIKENSYIYLSYLNTQYGLINGPYLFNEYWDINNIVPLLENKSVIYSSGKTKIYK